MPDTAKVDLNLEKSFDAHIYKETLKIKEGRPKAKILIQKSESRNRSFQHSWYTHTPTKVKAPIKNLYYIRLGSPCSLLPDHMHYQNIVSVTHSVGKRL